MLGGHKRYLTVVDHKWEHYVDPGGLHLVHFYHPACKVIIIKTNNRVVNMLKELYVRKKLKSVCPEIVVLLRVGNAVKDILAIRNNNRVLVGL